MGSSETISLCKTARYCDSEKDVIIFIMLHVTVEKHSISITDVFGFGLQAAGGSPTPTKCTCVPDIWWLERGHNSSSIGIKYTVTERTCQQIEILFQWQVFKMYCNVECHAPSLEPFRIQFMVRFQLWFSCSIILNG